MISREELKKEVNKLPDGLLDRLYAFIEKNGPERENRSATNN